MYIQMKVAIITAQWKPSAIYL